MSSIIEVPKLLAYPNIVEDILGLKRRIAICIVLAEDNPDPLAIRFGLGEAVCNPVDNFDKRIGSRIAENRAIGGGNLEKWDGATSFTLKEALVLDSDDTGPVSNIKTPITQTPVPLGMISRLRFLVGRQDVIDLLRVEGGL